MKLLKFPQGSVLDRQAHGLLSLGLRLLILIVASSLVGPALARSLDAIEKAALEKTIDEFSTAMREKKYERVIDTIPPKVLESIAKKSGVSATAYRRGMIEAMEGMSDVTIESFVMDFAKAEFKELPNGTPYVLIPTTTVVDGGDTGRLKSVAHSLAFQDAGAWYLLSADDVQQLSILRDVYPDFGSVEFARGTLEMLKK